MVYQKFGPAEELTPFVECYFAWESCCIAGTPMPRPLTKPVKRKGKFENSVAGTSSDIISRVDIIDSYVNSDESAVTVEFHCHISQPACTLRIVDRFAINEEGEITEQENFFDRRDITNPGWR